MAVTINGTTGITTTGDYDAEDGDKILLGTDDDLQIYHDGSNSYLEAVSTGAGDLIVQGTGKKVKLRPKSGEDGVVVIDDGAVELYYDNVKKMDTLTDGIGVVGVVYSQGLDVDDNHYIKVGSGDDLQIHHDGTDSYIVNTTGELKITDSSIIRLNTDDFRVYKGDGSELTFRAEGDGGCSLFYNNTAVLVTTGAGISVGEMRSNTTYNATTSNSANMYIHSDPYVIYRSTSSIKYKDNVTTLTDADADKILNCRPVTYTSKCNIDDSNEIHYGLIAEEVKDVDSRLVVFDGTEPENVKYDRFVPHLINLVKRLTDEVNTLKTKVAALEAA